MVFNGIDDLGTLKSLPYREALSLADDLTLHVASDRKTSFDDIKKCTIASMFLSLERLQDEHLCFKSIPS